MLLALTALGYASVWLQGPLLNEETSQRLGQLLGLPPGKTARVVLPLGVASESGHPNEKLPFEARAWFNRMTGG